MTVDEALTIAHREADKPEAALPHTWTSVWTALFILAAEVERLRKEGSSHDSE